MSALRVGPLAAVVAFALVIVAVAVGAPGDLDPTFGVNGRVTLSPFVESYAASIAVQPDGKLVLAGAADDEAPPPPPPPAPGGPHSSNQDFLAIRLTPNGNLDPAFGSGGFTRTPIDSEGLPASDGARAVAFGADGSIILAGLTVVGNGTDFAFARYTPSGALDPTFSGDGIQTLDVGGYDGADGVAVQPDGKVVAVGPGGSGFTVVRLLTNGQLDPSFGNGGVVDSNIGDPALQDDAAAVLVRNGKIVVAGTADVPNFIRRDLALARYLANGQPDTSFGEDGTVVLNNPGEDRATALAATPDGKLVVAGLTGGPYLLARYLADGSLDRSFGGSGVVTTPFQGLLANAQAVAVQADGKIVAAGVGLSYNESAFTAARYTVDGRLDPAFGGDGKGVFDVPTIRLYGSGAVIQRSTDPGAAGRLVIAGQLFEGTADHVAAVGIDLGRLEAAPRPVRCRVPRVIRLRLALAKKRIRRANCSVGRVRRARSLRPRGRVIGQKPRAGLVKPRGTRVSLVVSRGRR